jgi:hypothetical protein
MIRRRTGRVNSWYQNGEPEIFSSGDRRLGEALVYHKTALQSEAERRNPYLATPLGRILNRVLEERRGAE